MDYLRQQRLLAEADAIAPGLGAELAESQLSSAELDDLESHLDQTRKHLTLQRTLQADNKRQADEYRRRAARLQAKLAARGLDPGRMPRAGLAAAKHLAGLAGGLGLHSAAEAGMVAAWVSSDMERLEREKVQYNRKAVAAEMRQAASAAARQAASLRASLDAASDAQRGARREAAELDAARRTMDAKADGYRQQIETHQAKLAQLGFSEKLSHESLAALSAQCDSLETALGEAREALSLYREVPPSLAALEEQLGRLSARLEELGRQMGGRAGGGAPF